MIDRKTFFDRARAAPFGGSFCHVQVDGLNTILDGWEARPEFIDLRWLAYILATTFWETGRTIYPVREAYWLSEDWRRANLRYYPYYGRGYVQLTWPANYERMGKLLGVPLLDKPDLALVPEHAAQIMFTGMRDGLFTGHSLAMHFDAVTDDPVGARRIINGTDRAEEIAEFHRQFLAALT